MSYTPLSIAARTMPGDGGVDDTAPRQIAVISVGDATLYVYESQTDPGALVVDLDTAEAGEAPTAIRLCINDGAVYSAVRRPDRGGSHFFEATEPQPG